MKYVMSDIHGCYDEFIAMLNKINFSKEDKLYILGDILDRGNKPIDILDYVIAHKNIYLIKGNHEKLFEETFIEGNKYLWYINGGESTDIQIMQKPYYYKKSLYHYISRLPYIKVVDKFILVHAGVYFPSNYKELTIEEFIDLQGEETCLWDRNSANDEKKFKDYTIIHGHTPVQAITNNCEDVKIIRKPGHIYIDCGCVFKKANGKLGCLCLDNMQEYYV